MMTKEKGSEKNNGRSEKTEFSEGKFKKVDSTQSNGEIISVDEFMKRSFEDKSTYEALKRLSEK